MKRVPQMDACTYEARLLVGRFGARSKYADGRTKVGPRRPASKPF